MAKQINVFQKGLIFDNDPSYQPNTSWTFPTNNIRLLNKEGQGFVITPIKGTITNTDMHMNGGYLAIAAEEHRGIIYIVSVNETGDTEIGTYPSPKDYTDTNTEFVNEYKTLHNYTTHPTNSFNTSLFRYTQESNLKLIIDDTFDESANLYLCDGVNIDKIVNCGFKYTGESNGITYTDNNFKNTLNHISITDSPPRINTAKTVSGGSLKPGNYFIYLRYETKRFDGTDYFPGISPIQVGVGNAANNSMGLSDKNINGSQKRTSSAIELHFDINSFDNDYTFLRIGIIRYYSVDSDFPVQDIWRISNNYRIADIIDNNGELIITGTETETLLSINRIILQNVKERISNDHIFLDKRIWKAGLRRDEFNHEPLAEFAKKITVDSVTEPLDDISGYQLLQGTDYSQYGYQDSDKLLNNLGYFGGEIYPFAMIAQLTDDTYTEAYPIQGSDGLELATKLDIDLNPSNTGISGRNYKGLYRFPYAGYKEWIYPTFDFSAANSYYDIHQSDFKNIKNIFIARTDKIENRIYSGLTTKTARGVGFPVSVNLITNTDWNALDDPDGYSIPVFYNQSDFYKRGHFLAYGIQDTQVTNTKWTYEAAGTRAISKPIDDVSNEYYKDLSKIALLSPDQILSFSDKINPGENLWIKIHSEVPRFNPDRYEYSYESIIEGNAVATAPRINMIDIWNVNDVSNKEMKANCFPIEKSTYKGTNKFTSLLEDGQSATRYGWKKFGTGLTYYNRSYATAPYIGLEITEGKNLISKDDYPFERIVTIYKQENNANFFISTLGAYSTESKDYSIISEAFKISENSNAIRIEKGDNFKMRFFIRAFRWQGLDYNAEYHWISTQALPKYKNHYQSGLVIGFICDSSVNIAMRNQVEAMAENNYARYTFFPRQLIENSFDGWCFLSKENDDAVESIQVNHGYDKVLDAKSEIGYSKDMPKDDLYKPTKIAFSSENIIEGIFNNYRIIPSTNVQYFRTDYGEIKRLSENYGELFSIRERAIMRHFIGQTKLTEDVFLEQDAIYLSDKELAIFYYGIKDWHALVKSNTAIYGVDRTNMILWRIIVKYTSSGSRVPQVEFLSKEKFIDSKMQNVLTKLNPDFTSPVVDNGISISFNRNFDEISFNFLNDEYKKSYIFNERLDTFISTSDLVPAVFSNKDDFMYVFPTKSLKKYSIYRADVNVDGSIIFDTQFDNQLAIIVNGTGGDEKSNSQLLTKIYGALEIDCPEEDLKSIRYETGSQDITYTFQSNLQTEFWKNSEWAEGKWIIPVITDDNTELRFVWMKITFTFQQGFDFYIRKIINNFDISFI